VPEGAQYVNHPFTLKLRRTGLEVLVAADKRMPKELHHATANDKGGRRCDSTCRTCGLPSQIKRIRALHRDARGAWMDETFH
jgi:hypothetical protein